MEKAKESGDISWIKNGTVDLEDILRLEMLPEGGKDKSYILADLYNAIGMMTVHMQVCAGACPLCSLVSQLFTESSRRAALHTPRQGCSRRGLSLIPVRLLAHIPPPCARNAYAHRW